MQSGQDWSGDDGVLVGNSSTNVLMVNGDSPRVRRVALYSLRALISGGFGSSSGGVIEARSYSLSQRGEAAATSGSRPCPTARSVSFSQSESELVAARGGNVRKGS